MKKRVNRAMRRSVYLETQQRVDRWVTGIFIVFVALVPLIMRLKAFLFISPVLYPGAMGTGGKGDVFNYYKYVFLLLVTVVVAALFVYKMTKGRYEVHPGYANPPLAVAFVLFLASGLTASYMSLALGGDPSRYEGTLTYLCYFALFLIAANTEYTERRAELLMYALAVPVALNVLISLMYFYGHDMFQIPWVRALVVPPGPGAEKTTGYLVTTLANPNYLSGFAAVTTALFWTRAMWNGGRWVRWGADVILAALSFAAVLASTSASGFTTLVGIFVVLAVAGLRLRPRRGWLGFAVPLAAFAGVFAILSPHNPAVWQNTIGTFVNVGGLDQQGAPGSPGPLAAGYPRAEAAEPPGAAAAATEQGASNEGGSAAERGAVAERGTAVERGAAAELAAGHLLAAGSPQGEPQPNAPDGIYLPPAETGAGTGRLYIWKWAVSMIGDAPWLGHGMDTFMFYFPQDDPAKNSNLHDYNIIVDKPHNMYLAWAFGAGVPALLALLVLFALHAWNTVATLWRRILPEQAVRLLMPLFAAWVAWLAQGMVNDSVIGMSAVVWVLFGAAVSLLFRYRPRTEPVKEGKG